jgi:hypothetical protein
MMGTDLNKGLPGPPNSGKLIQLRLLRGEKLIDGASTNFQAIAGGL